MIIKSILDTDLYKLTMQSAVIKQFPNAKVKYSFINRGGDKFPDGFADILKEEIKSMERLFLTENEKKFITNNCYYFTPPYIDLLSGYRFDSSEVKITQNDGDLHINIEGFWYRTILWEVPLMALISELYFKMTKQKPIDFSERMDRLREKLDIFNSNGIKYADFGTRRRFSYNVHNEILSNIKNYNPIDNKCFVGTSNIYLAYKHNFKPIGTHAHEWFSFHAAKYGFKKANFMAMENWVDTFRGDLGIVLPDTFTTRVFFNDFDKKFSKLYDGLRHDSGDPFKFVDNVILHYLSVGIDPMSKTIIFSDGLDKDIALRLNNYCKGKINCSMGIGTNLTNDVGVKPLNMVIKMIEAKPDGENWISTIKLSDNEGKYTGDLKMIELAKQILSLN